MSTFTRLGQIFWGLLMVIVDFRFDGFDILPDFMGYILVAVGCGGLSDESPHFLAARTWSWLLVILSIVEFFIPSGLAFAFGALAGAANCVMMWFLLGGITDFAAARGRSDLSSRALNRRVAYVGIVGLAILVGLFPRGLRDPMSALGAVLSVCMLIVLVLIVHLIYRVRHELATENAA
ncbi:MAG TPA: hypothetical protein VHC19_06750 [Pirellulales bacterium]|nr:hypothetical protein [Pirellulales bacterium]